MFQALFNSLSGLFSFSKSLNTVSNNISNMNTPGFRGSDSFFSNINGSRGVRVAGEGMRSTAGDIRQTGNATDLAVDGDGFFVLRDADGNLHYTRAGQFRFNDDGILVDTVSGFEVMGLDEGGSLVSIDIDTYRSLAAEPSTQVRFAGNLAPGSTTTSVNSIVMYDPTGAAHTLSATFTNNSSATPGSFLVTVVDESGATVGSGEIRFRTDGTPLTGFSELTLDLTYNGTNQSVVLNFGTPGALDGATSLSGMATNLATRSVDGHGVLGLSDLSFDEKGVLQLIYSETEKQQGPQIALATFPDESALRMTAGRMVSGAATNEREIGRPGDGRFGRIADGSLEMSNVDLTQEFADMIIIQRGYQASSRVMTVSNEMLEQLYNSTRGG
ncbi:flagellar basal-body rod protein FlgF [Marilutibacter alkalisoli]|uniref:Flagellar basal-body rod protein FlgF n=1 Tax=Marilutibacter alkalisoli TaxID=2591633 RepID=A0A514BS04_9GAMM|nr:flagellar basal-body rod protein FlgF [Lysobacter alkalisoli]QDH70140.1 flagellar basal-body rod protein FlgF [Lysobacter alkalisoli]